MNRDVEPRVAECLTTEQLRSNRRTLAALFLVTLFAAVAAGIGLVGRIVDSDSARPNRAGASTLDGGRSPERSAKGNDGNGVLVVTAVGAVAAACVAAPFVIARRRRRTTEGLSNVRGESEVGSR